MHPHFLCGCVSASLYSLTLSLPAPFLLYFFLSGIIFLSAVVKMYTTRCLFPAAAVLFFPPDKGDVPFAALSGAKGPRECDLGPYH